MRIRPYVRNELFIICFQILLLKISAFTVRRCPDVTWSASEVSGTCVKPISDEKKWDEARAACLNYRGDLVTILDDKMAKFIFDLTKNMWSGLWIGLKATAQKSDLVYSTGFTYKWVNGIKNVGYEKISNPKDFNGEGCISLEPPSHKWTWNTCDNRKGYICEIGKLCEDNWIQSNQSRTCVKFAEEKTGWENARNACRRQNGDLVSILNKGMKKFLRGNMKRGNRKDL
ncbi:macrophage mannose receptor 1 [Elysia marginata]|uniref:Macrophage mannose receptor 1 n=1 Tax=Elysia marginata TaxID=1093978 RepID=A0AAV4IJZ6_9GAST|nr:macrophage mannose receptor 1 [Elysia marginata]